MITRGNIGSVITRGNIGSVVTRGNIGSVITRGNIGSLITRSFDTPKYWFIHFWSIRDFVYVLRILRADRFCTWCRGFLLHGRNLVHFDVLISNFESEWNYFEFLTPHKAIGNALVRFLLHLLHVANVANLLAFIIWPLRQKYETRMSNTAGFSCLTAGFSSPTGHQGAPVVAERQN